MHHYDSSLTRVAPVFSQIPLTQDPGSLLRLLALPQFGHQDAAPPATRGPITDGPHFGDHERSLDAPLSLLSWLIRHPEKLRQRKAADEAGGPRRALLDGDRGTMLEALRLLSTGSAERWHIFEGQSCPDVYIETAGLIVVVEGKRTEHGPTTQTTWMEVRHQMLRHIDCAWEIRGSKQVLGFFIVEGDGAATAVPAKWQAFARETISPAAIAASLPHRGPEEERQIAACFAGATTWQRVCQEFGLAWQSLPDTTAPAAANRPS
jgi:hypothetical protein